VAEQGAEQGAALTLSPAQVAELRRLLDQAKAADEAGKRVAADVMRAGLAGWLDAVLGLNGV
jgi:hypothetical protein